MRLQFFGATGTVTGSKYLLEHGGRKLLVDCGLFQGVKQLRLRNWQPLPLPPTSTRWCGLARSSARQDELAGFVIGE